MGLARRQMTSHLLILLTAISSAAPYAYGNGTVNQAVILIQLAILIVLAWLNGILYNRFVLIVLFLNVSSLTITLAFHNAFGVSIVFINLLIACFIFNNIRVDKKTYILIHLIAAILWTGLVGFAKHGFYITDWGDVYSYRFLGAIYHKNFIGMLTLGCVYHWLSLIEMLLYRKITKLMIGLPIIAVAIFKMVESDCRSVLIATAVFTILYLTVRKDIPYRIYYIIATVAIILSGVFTIYYVGNITEVGVEDFMGRTTFNRLETWEAAFSLIRQYPIFGSGTDLKMATYDSAHNTILSILKTMGLIPTLSYVVCFAQKLVEKKIESNRVCQLAIISGLIISVFESFYVESFVYMPFILLLINIEKKEQENEIC